MGSSSGLFHVGSIHPFLSPSADVSWAASGVLRCPQPWGSRHKGHPGLAGPRAGVVSSGVTAEPQATGEVHGPWRGVASALWPGAASTSSPANAGPSPPLSPSHFPSRLKPVTLAPPTGRPLRHLAQVGLFLHGGVLSGSTAGSSGRPPGGPPPAPAGGLVAVAAGPLRTMAQPCLLPPPPVPQASLRV